MPALSSKSASVDGDGGGNASPMGRSTIHDARSQTGTYVSGSQASSSNTFQRRERAIWNKPTYRYQSLDPAQPFYVDPRIVQVVAKMDPKVLQQISIPDGMNLHGKIHKTEKPKAVLFEKRIKEERKMKAEEAAQKERSRRTLLALNEDIRTRCRPLSGTDHPWQGKGDAQENADAPPGVTYLLPRSKSEDMQESDPFATFGDIAAASTLRPATAVPIVRKVGRKFCEQMAMRRDAVDRVVVEDGLGRMQRAMAKIVRRRINHGLPWADKVREAKERKAGQESKDAPAPATDNGDEWAELLGNVACMDKREGQEEQQASKSSLRAPVRARIDTGRRKATASEIAAAASQSGVFSGGKTASVEEQDTEPKTYSPKELKEWMTSVKNKDMSRMRELLAAHASLLNSKQPGIGNSALHWAAAKDHTWQLKLLINANANLSLRSASAATPLHCAAMHGSIGALTALLEAGADMDMRDENGDTPRQAALSSRESRVRGLEEGKKDNASEAQMHEHMHLRRRCTKDNASEAQMQVLKLDEVVEILDLFHLIRILRQDVQVEGEEQQEGGGSWRLGNLKQLLALANMDTASIIDDKDLVATAKQYLDGLAKGLLPLRQPKPSMPPKDGPKNSGGAGFEDREGATKAGGGGNGKEGVVVRVSAADVAGGAGATGGGEIADADAAMPAAPRRLTQQHVENLSVSHGKMGSDSEEKCHTDTAEALQTQRQKQRLLLLLRSWMDKSFAKAKVKAKALQKHIQKQRLLLLLRSWMAKRKMAREWMAKRKIEEQREREEEQKALLFLQRTRNEVLKELRLSTVEEGRLFRAKVKAKALQKQIQKQRLLLLLRSWMAKRKMEEEREKEDEQKELRLSTVEEGLFRAKPDKALAHKHRKASDSEGEHAAKQRQAPRGSHQWQVKQQTTIEPASQCAKQVPSARERLRKMQEYGLEVRERRLAAKAAVGARKERKEALVSLVRDALSRLPRESVTEVPHSHSDDAQHSRVHQGLEPPRIQAEEKAQSQEGGPGDACSVGYDTFGAISKHGCKNPSRNLHRVVLLPSRQALMAEQQRRDEILHLLLPASSLSSSMPRSSQHGHQTPPDAQAGDDAAAEDGSKGARRDQMVLSPAAQRVRRMQALRDTAQDLSTRVSTLSHLSRQARDQADISSPCGNLSDEVLASMNRPLRSMSDKEQEEKENVGAAQGDRGKQTSSVAGLVSLDGGVEEDQDMSDGSETSEVASRAKSLDESLREVEELIASKKHQRQHDRQHMTATQDKQHVASTEHDHAQSVESWRHADVVLNEDGGRGISYEGPRTYAADAHEVEAAEEDTDTCVLMGKQRMRLGMSGSAFSASHTSANAAGSVRTSLFMDQDDETDILHDIMQGMSSGKKENDPFSLLNILRRNESTPLQGMGSALAPASAPPPSAQFLPRPHEHAQEIRSKEIDLDKTSQAGGSSGILEVPEREEEVDRPGQEERTASAADLLVARANALLPRGGHARRGLDRGEDVLESLEARVSVRRDGGGLSEEETLRHQANLEQYWAHRQGPRGSAAAPADDACVVDLIFEPAWLLHTASSRDDKEEVGSAEDTAHIRREVAVHKRGAEVILDLAECLGVGVHRFQVQHIAAGQPTSTGQVEGVLRLLVLGASHAVESTHVGIVVDTQRPQHIVGRLVTAALDVSSALRQRPSLSLLRTCLVHSGLAASNNMSPTPASAAVPNSASPALAHLSGGLASDEGGVKRRLSPDELQQRLLAEVDYLDEMHNAEYQLISMVQVQQVAAAQEEAVVLAQALLDRERLAAEEREKEVMAGEAKNAMAKDLVGEMQQSLRETTEAFMQALNNAASHRQQPSAEALTEMRQEHARQLQAIVDAFTDAMSGGGRVEGRGSASEGNRVHVGDTSVAASPGIRRSPSPYHKASTPTSAGKAGKVGGLTMLTVDTGAKDSSTSAVESDYTADFEDVNEQSIAEEDMPSVQTTPAQPASASNKFFDAADQSAHSQRSVHSLPSQHSRGRASPSSLSHRSDRSRPSSVSLRVPDQVVDEATGLASVVADETIQDQVGYDDLLSRSVHDSLVASQVSASRVAAIESYTHEYSEDFEDQYSEDFESHTQGLSQSIAASQSRHSAALATNTSVNAGARSRDGGRETAASARNLSPRFSAAKDGDRSKQPAQQDASLSHDPTDMSLVMYDLPSPMQKDEATRKTVAIVRESMKEAHGRAQQQRALLRLQEEALDERAHAQLQRLGEQRKQLHMNKDTDRDGKQRILDDKERTTRMRLAADKADLQRQRAAVRAELMRELFELQEQSNAFLASRVETLILKGVLPPNQHHTTDFFQMQQSPLESSRLPASSASLAGRDSGGEGQEEHLREEQEAAYDSDTMESIASELIEGWSVHDGSMLEAQDERLHVESVRQLAKELGKHHRDPTGTQLEAREKSAAEKRAYALELLDQKEAAVARRRRELRVEAEERRSAELLDRALRIDVDEEAQRSPPPDDSDELWDMTDAPQPGTPASFVSPYIQPNFAATDRMLVAPGALATPPRPGPHEAGGHQRTEVDAEAWSEEEDDDGISPPPSAKASSVASAESEGLFVRTAFDPFSAAGGPQGSIASDLSDPLSDVSVDQVEDAAHDASSAIHESLPHLADGEREAEVSIIEEDTHLTIQSSNRSRQPDEASQIVESLELAHVRKEEEEDASVSEVMYSQNFEDESGGVSQAAPESLSEDYTQDFEQATASRTIHESIRSAALSSPSVMVPLARDSVFKSHASDAEAAYSNTFESDTGLYSNTFEPDSTASARKLRPDEEEAEEVMEATAGEVSTGESINEDIQDAGVGGDSITSSASSSTRNKAGVGAVPSAPGVGEGAVEQPVSDGAGQGEDDAQSTASQVYSDSFVADSMSQSMLGDAGRVAGMRSSEDGLQEADKRTASYSDSFVVESQEALSAGQPSAPLCLPSAALPETASSPAPPAAATVGTESLVEEDIATDMSAEISQEVVSESEEQRAALVLQQIMRRFLACRSLLRQQQKRAAAATAAATAAAAEAAHTKREDVAEPSHEKEVALQSPAAKSEAYSTDFAHESIIEESMDFASMDRSMQSDDAKVASNKGSKPQTPKTPPASHALSTSPVLHGVSAQDQAEEHLHVDPDFTPQGEEGCPPVSTPSLSPRRPTDDESEVAVGALESIEEAQRGQRGDKKGARPQEEEEDSMTAHEQVATSTATARGEAEAKSGKEKAAEAALEAEAAISRANRARSMVTVSDALLAQVLEDVVIESYEERQRVAALARSPAAVKTPTKTRDDAERERDSPSPGALSLLADSLLPPAAPLPTSPSAHDSPQPHKLQAPTAGGGKAASDKVVAESEEALIAAATTGAKTAATAMAYARLLLSSVDDATLSQGLTDACFVQLARAKLRHASGDDDIQVFHKLIFDLVKSLVHKPSYLAAGCGLQVQLRLEVLRHVERLAQRGDRLPANAGAASSAHRQVPSRESDFAALQLLFDEDLIEMEKEWLCYDAEEDVVSIAVADAIFEDLLVEVTQDLVDDGS